MVPTARAVASRQGNKRDASSEGQETQDAPKKSASSSMSRAASEAIRTAPKLNRVEASKVYKDDMRDLSKYLEAFTTDPTHGEAMGTIHNLDSNEVSVARVTAFGKHNSWQYCEFTQEDGLRIHMYLDANEYRPELLDAGRHGKVFRGYLVDEEDKVPVFFFAEECSVTLRRLLLSCLC